MALEVRGQQSMHPRSSLCRIAAILHSILAEHWIAHHGPKKLKPHFPVQPSSEIQPSFSKWCLCGCQRITRHSVQGVEHITLAKHSFGSHFSVYQVSMGCCILQGTSCDSDPSAAAVVQALDFPRRQHAAFAAARRPSSDGVADWIFLGASPETR